MAIRYSTGLRDKLNGLKATVKGAIVGDTLALVDGGASDDTITDSGNGFIDAGFAPGDVLFVQGCTTAANDSALTGVVITSVAAGTLTIPTLSVNTAEVLPAGGVIAVAVGGSLKDILKDGKLMIYTGSVFDPDDGPGTRTLLLTITESGGTFVHGAFDNGLELEEDPTGAFIEKKADEIWRGVAVASGVAGCFLYVANPTDALGSSTTLARFSGSCGGSTADMKMASTTITAGRTYTIDEVEFELPQYYGA